MSIIFRLVLGAALVVVVVFLALPVVALFLRVPPGELVAQLGDERALDALAVSLKTSAIAHLLILLVGTPAAYFVALRRFRGRALVVSLVELPLVLPPAVAGLGLLAAFGRSGLLGGELRALGLQIPFTQLAVVLAICFVASPFYIRAAITAFEGLDPALLGAARTLGAGPLRVFTRISLPLALGGLGAGSTLAFARGLGEFGATIMFAGSFPGRTQTAPLAIYDALDEDFEVALALGALLVAVSIGILLATKLLTSWTRSPSTSPIPFAPSSSR
ncbi:MAG: ABC transporter permease [Actinomycetota bacterium]|nr:ABC transporter permease [Actinomycetota bacterium]